MLAWRALPGRGVAVLGGVDAGGIAAAIDPLPEEAPAVLSYLPGDVRDAAHVVGCVLEELEKVAIALFPAWLPGAEGISGTGGASRRAVRELARRVAATTGHFGPFLADLAERSLTGRPARALAAETRAAGLVRVIAAGYDRRAVALLVHLPPGLSAPGEEALVAGCEWLADHGGLAVWLTGTPLMTVDRVPTVPVRLPAHSPHRPVSRSGSSFPQEPVSRPGPPRSHSGVPRRPVLMYPPVAGRPHPASEAERALEAALLRQEWAAGRAWNQTFQADPLAVPMRVDLLWRDERCVVEIDGPEHRLPRTFGEDRRRDVRLQLAGYAVLRFTNDQVINDTGTVVHQIGRFLRDRRAKAVER